MVPSARWRSVCIGLNDLLDGLGRIAIYVQFGNSDEMSVPAEGIG
jgi:hypothetical protein